MSLRARGGRSSSEKPGAEAVEERAGGQAAIPDGYWQHYGLPSGGGQPLPGPLRGQMERSLGSDFSTVRVHEGPQAAAVGAVAFTRGEQLHFEPGRYDPASTAGREVIGHELAHVVQQRAGRAAVPQGKGGLVNADPSLEAEADAAGARAARGEPARVGGAGSSATGVGQPIQRMLKFGAGGGDRKRDGDRDRDRDRERKKDPAPSTKTAAKPATAQQKRKRGAGQHALGSDDASPPSSPQASSAPAKKKQPKVDQSKQAPKKPEAGDPERKKEAPKKARSGSMDESGDSPSTAAAGGTSSTSVFSLQADQLHGDEFDEGDGEGEGGDGEDDLEEALLLSAVEHAKASKQASAKDGSDKDEKRAAAHSTAAFGVTSTAATQRPTRVRKAAKKDALFDWSGEASEAEDKERAEVEAAKAELIAADPDLSAADASRVAVQLRLAPSGAIADLIIPSSRPPGLFGGKTGQGSHTAAWGLVVASVREAVVGRTLAEARTGLGSLCDQVLPGLSGTLKPYVPPSLFAQLQAAIKVVVDARALCTAATTPQALYDPIQRLVSAYLSCRNLVPLSAVQEGRPSTGDGEAEHLATLRGASKSAKVLQTAILSLLDRHALALAGTLLNKPAPELPGVIPTGSAKDFGGQMAPIVIQHLITAARAFPDKFAAAKLTPAAVASFLCHAVEGSDVKREAAVVPDEKGLLAALNDLWKMLPDVSATAPNAAARAGGGGTLAVQIRLDDTGNAIASAQVSGRPPGLFGSNERKHVTAWVVSAAGLVDAVAGKSIAAARLAVSALLATAQALPGAGRTDFLSGAQRDGYLAALAAATAAETAATTAPSVDTLQAFMSAYLAYRNFVPLSVIDTVDKGTGGKAEGEHIATVRAAEQQLAAHGNPDRDVLQGAVWLLLDTGTIRAMHAGQRTVATAAASTATGVVPKKKGKKGKKAADTKDEVYPELPGVDPADTEGSAAAAVRQHLLTMQANFPLAFAHAFGGQSIDQWVQDYLEEACPST